MKTSHLRSIYIYRSHDFIFREVANLKCNLNFRHKHLHGSLCVCVQIGHPNVLENIVQTLLMAPYFVLLEVSPEALDASRSRANFSKN